MTKYEVELLRIKLDKKLQELPVYVGDYVYYIELNMKMNSCLSYLTDIDVFFNFLIKRNQENFIKKHEITIDELNKIDRSVIREYLSYLTMYEHKYQTKTGLTIQQTFENNNDSKMKKIIVIRSLFQFLRKEKLSFNNTSFDDIDLPRITHDGNIKERLDSNEVKLILNVIQKEPKNSVPNNFLISRDLLIVNWLLYTGVRISELLEIQTKDLDFKNNTFHIKRKGGKEQKLPLPELLNDLVNEYLKAKRTKGIQNDYLFVSLQSRKMSPKTVSTLLLKYSNKAGIKKRVTPHMLRRTYGTTFYNQHQDMYLTASVLGHSSAETTRKYYADPNTERISDAMQTFNYD